MNSILIQHYFHNDIIMRNEGATSTKSMSMSIIISKLTFYSSKASHGLIGSTLKFSQPKPDDVPIIRPATNIYTSSYLIGYPNPYSITEIIRPTSNVKIGMKEDDSVPVIRPATNIY